MHGPVPAQPPNRPMPLWAVVLLRIAFVAGAWLSGGLLAWLALLRAAVIQRRPLGWWLFGGDLVLVMATLLFANGHGENDWQSTVTLIVLLGQAAAASAYYLVVDVRAHRAAVRAHTPAYPPVPPYATTAPYAPPPPYGQPRPPAPANPYAQPAPQSYGYPHDPPRRISQVRAELDELSDYLRKEEGR
ncbi:hypothetical protein [Streptomyces sp. MST-110588]|uniref:hypothetical protein n=1 Tax=Streptomyces sp. MST-110588 TaxID=2833628 RepID=UPI001F5CD388|nr:hypothetical protein [Streptomyces sp. MST-110588]UNO41601.1 hypothetical protein KGS77_21165 [Streptomyces sp. MST-110588]